MICSVESISVGNALKIIIDLPDTTTQWRLLRKTTDTITGFDDPSADIICESTDTYTRQALVDDRSLDNGTTYFYQSFYFDDVQWIPSSVVSAIPDTTYTDQSTDCLVVLRDRLKVGLKAAIANNWLTPRTKKIDVLTAPPLEEHTPFPVVTVQLVQDAAAEHFVGELLGSDSHGINEAETELGWLSRWQLSVTAWSLNPDERIQLRQALKHIVLANNEVFNEHGMVQVQFELSDQEDFASFSTPIYMAAGTFTCLAPTQITETHSTIKTIEVLRVGDS